MNLKILKIGIGMTIDCLIFIKQTITKTIKFLITNNNIFISSNNQDMKY